MSGHSKWATTKHKKAVIDSRRAKLFAKFIKNIEVAARAGGADLTGNPALYDAVQRAKKSSVPNDNIERALKRGAGLIAGGAQYQTIMYEGYGPAGVAFLVECLSDNKNRAASEVRVAVTRNGGTMADPGSVSYLFSRQGVILLPKEYITEDDLFLAVLEAGAEQIKEVGDNFEIICDPSHLFSVRAALEEASIEYDSADIQFLPSLEIPLDIENSRKLFKIVDALEDLDDVQNVYFNAEIADDVLQQILEQN